MIMTSKMQFYHTEEGTEMVVINPVKVAFLSVAFGNVGQGGNTWQKKC